MASPNLKLVYSATDTGTKTTPIISAAKDRAEILKDDIEAIKSTQKEILNLVLEQSQTNTFNAKNLLSASGGYSYQGSISITSNDYILSTFLTSTEAKLLDKKNINNHEDANLQVGVPLYLILELGAAILGTICTASLLTWVDSSVPLINPILSFIGLIASPFFYAMGRVSRKDHQ